MNKICSKALQWLTLIFFITISIAILINPEKYARAGAAKFNTFSVIIFFILLCTLIYFIYRLFMKFSEKQFKIAFGILYFVVVLYQIFFLYNAYTPIGWDVKAVILQATGTMSVDDYFIAFPNNIFICFIYKFFFYTLSYLGFNNYWLEAVILNLIIVDTSVLLIIVISKELFNKKVYTVINIISILFIVLSPYITIPYTDTLGMIFPLLMIFLFVKFKDKTKFQYSIIYYLLLAVLIYLGYKVKPTVIFPGVLMLIYSLYIDLKRNKKVLVLITPIIIIAFIMCSLAFSVISDVVITGDYDDDYKNNYEVPFTHYLAMGLGDGDEDSFELYEGYCYGSFSSLDTYNTAEVIGKKEKMEYNIEVVKSRVSKKGFLGTLEHLFNKLIWTHTDGTFFYGGEDGDDFHSGEQMSDRGERGYIFKHLTYVDTEFYQKYYMNYLQALWLMVIILCGISAVKIKDGNNDVEYIVKISIIMLAVFLMLFETRARYLVSYLPLYILLAGFGIDYATNFLSNLNHK